MQFVFLFFFFAGSYCVADGSTTAYLTFQPLSFQAGTGGVYTAQANGLVFSLKNPEDAKQPQAWDSALSIANPLTSSHCSTEPLLVQRVHIASSGAALVVHFSGSTTYIDLFDTNTCKQRLSRIEAMTEKVVVDGDRVEIWPGCEPVDAKISTCSAARVFHIDEHFARSEWPDAADALTKQIVGVAFKGVNKVRNAKSNKAELVK